MTCTGLLRREEAPPLLFFCLFSLLEIPTLTCNFPVMCDKNKRKLWFDSEIVMSKASFFLSISEEEGPLLVVL